MDGLSVLATSFNFANLMGHHYLEHPGHLSSTSGFLRGRLGTVDPETPQERLRAPAGTQYSSGARFTEWWGDAVRAGRRPACRRWAWNGRSPRVRGAAAYAPCGGEPCAARLRAGSSGRGRAWGAQLYHRAPSPPANPRRRIRHRDDPANRPPRAARCSNLLLRHSMLIEYAQRRRAPCLAARGPRAGPPSVASPELVRLSPLGQLSMTIWRPAGDADQPCPRWPSRWRSARTCSASRRTARPNVGREFRPAAPQRFSFLPREPGAAERAAGRRRLEQLMRRARSISASPPGLDAWITSLATKRLAQMREASLHRGPGWAAATAGLMNLAPGAAPRWVVPPTARGGRAPSSSPP